MLNHEAKRDERIAELYEFGIMASKGPYQGWIAVSAMSVDKLLRLLRKLKRLESKEDQTNGN